MKPLFDWLVYGGILVLAITMAIGWTIRIRQHNQKLGDIAAICFAAIAVLGGVASYLELFSAAYAQPPLFAIVAVPLLIGFIGFALSQYGLALAQHLDWKVLVGLQIFRLPLELFMLRAALLGIMPQEFSMLGYNFDVLSGTLSLLVFIYLTRAQQTPKLLLWIWNIFGIACLLVIGVLAVLTNPTMHAFGTSPERINTWVLYFPYVYLPLLLVNFAVMGHMLATRKLLNSSS